MGEKKHDIHKCFRDEHLKEGNKTLKKKYVTFVLGQHFQMLRDNLNIF